MSELEPTRTYSNHTATDELRRMLDERGVEWRRTPHYSSESMDNETVFCGIGIEWLASDHLNGRLGLRALKYEVTPEQAIEATLGDADAVEVVRCRDCKHGHITINGKSCKWCDLIATHDIDGNEPNNGYDPEPYFDADFFCAWGERRED